MEGTDYSVSFFFITHNPNFDLHHCFFNTVHQVEYSTSSCRQISLIMSRTRGDTSSFKSFLRYFVIHTKCRCIENTVWVPWRYVSIAYFNLRCAEAAT